MRIDNRFIKNKDNFKKGKTSDKSGTSFLETIHQMSDEDELPFELEHITQNDFKNLAGLIEQIGESLTKNPTPEEFVRYKKHIKNFIKLLQDNYEIKETYARKNFREQKLYKTIEVIDKSLSEIASLILNGEKNRMQYLNLINNIKGLIIDLTW